MSSYQLSPFRLVILPRQAMTWEEFVRDTPPRSIALDGVVRGKPCFHPVSHHVNFDHHNGVARDATMSTAMQVFFAVKGGLFDALMHDGMIDSTIFINDTDQDTSLAVWLLLHHSNFEGTKSIPHINRLLTITDRLDITAGAFPMVLDEQIVRQHNWVFQPYNDLRKTGQLAQASEQTLRDNLEAVLGRLNAFMMGQAQEMALDTRHIILHDSPRFKIVDEIGGSEARYFLFSKGMNAYISLVARRSDGRFVYTAGRRSGYIQYPLEALCDDFNAAEGMDSTNGWGGSDIVIGSSRLRGSGLSWEQLRDITNRRLEQPVN